jgi:hypothetical protein
MFQDRILAWKEYKKDNQDICNPQPLILHVNIAPQPKSTTTLFPTAVLQFWLQILLHKIPLLHLLGFKLTPRNNIVRPLRPIIINLHTNALEVKPPQRATLHLLLILRENIVPQQRLTTTLLLIHVNSSLQHLHLLKTIIHLNIRLNSTAKLPIWATILICIYVQWKLKLEYIRMKRDSIVQIQKSIIILTLIDVDHKVI